MSIDFDNGSSGRGRKPFDINGVLLVLSFIALTIGCIILAVDLFTRRLPLGPPV
jgi:hypothetical protein